MNLTVHFAPLAIQESKGRASKPTSQLWTVKGVCRYFIPTASSVAHVGSSYAATTSNGRVRCTAKEMVDGLLLLRTRLLHPPQSRSASLPIPPHRPRDKIVVIQPSHGAMAV